jgi:YebC/PmpR family DNA-binding regulatory protein
MSGHSHWSTIKRKKGAADARRGQLFTKLAKELTMAAREGGGDPEMNLRLQYAIDRAKSNNMPKDNIERAIKRGTGELKDGLEMEEIYYEGYAPHGIALMIFCVTENRNRTVSEVRHILTRSGGTLADVGSVAWQFTRSSFFTFPCEECDQDMVFELAVEAGADDVTFEDGQAEMIGEIEVFGQISKHLKQAGIKPEVAELRLIPNNPVDLDKDQTIQVFNVIDSLEDLDDVQEVYSTLNLSEDMMTVLESA